MMIDCPALHARHHAKGYPFGERVPAKIRLTRTVRPDFPLIMMQPDPPVAANGAVYECWVNSYGAVTVVFPDGRKLGVKPDEFEVVEWLEVQANQSALRRNDATG